jgi:hypothetical protein
MRLSPIQDKKMVDGKGGNLKTIHHYKTERVFLTTPLSDFFLSQHPPVTERVIRNPGNLTPRKKHPYVYFGYSSCPPCRPVLPNPIPDSRYPPGLRKNRTPESGRDRGSPFSLCCAAGAPSFFLLPYDVLSLYHRPQAVQRRFMTSQPWDRFPTDVVVLQL